MNPAAVYQYKGRDVFFRVQQDPENPDQVIIERQNTSGKGADALREDQWKRQETKRQWAPESTLPEDKKRIQREDDSYSKVERLRKQIDETPKTDKTRRKQLQRDMTEAMNQQNTEVGRLKALSNSPEKDREIERLIAERIFSPAQAKELFGYEQDRRKH